MQVIAHVRNLGWINACLYVTSRLVFRLSRGHIRLIKYWLSVSDEEQEHRFQQRAGNPAKRWKLSSLDLASREHWVEYSRAKDTMMEYTDIREAPWYQIEADDKRRAHLNCLRHLLSLFPYQEAMPKPVRLRARPTADGQYVRPPRGTHPVVQDYYANSLD